MADFNRLLFLFAIALWKPQNLNSHLENTISMLMSLQAIYGQFMIIMSTRKFRFDCLLFSFLFTIEWCADRIPTKQSTKFLNIHIVRMKLIWISETMECYFWIKGKATNYILKLHYLEWLYPNFIEKYCLQNKPLKVLPFVPIKLVFHD